MARLLDTFFNLPVLAEALPLLLWGLAHSLLLGLTAIACGLTLGIAIALVRLYAPRWGRWLAVVYIDTIRALPALVLIIILYHALPFVGITLSSFAAAAAALSMVMAAYTAEVVRAGIEAIPKGQFEAGSALGLHFPQVLFKIVLPQALRIVMPPTTSNCISAIKETSLASAVAMPDLLKNALDAQAFHANSTPLMGMAALYLILLLPLVRLVSALEARSKRGPA